MKDPWNLLGKKLRSAHCKGKSAEVVSYDHTGYIEARCECGSTYIHDRGVSEKKIIEKEYGSVENLLKIIADLE